MRDTKQIRAEIITALAVADRLYSEVEENVPDPSPLSANRKEIEIILVQVSFTVHATRSKSTRCVSFRISKLHPWNYWVTCTKANTPLKVTVRRHVSTPSHLSIYPRCHISNGVRSTACPHALHETRTLPKFTRSLHQYVRETIMRLIHTCPCL